jgi:hypothetical protein
MMQNPKTNNEKIRSILALMERSIDVARRKRLNEPDEETHLTSPDHLPTEAARKELISNDQAHRNGPTESTSSPNWHTSNGGTNGDVDSNGPAQTSNTDASPQRLKAKPKRPSDFFRPHPESNWQSRVG